MQISRGEIWVVNLDPTNGAEIRKTRPVVVVSSDAIGALPINWLRHSPSGKITLLRISGM